MQARRLAKRSSLGSRRGGAALQPPGPAPAPAPAGEGAPPGPAPPAPPAPGPGPESWRPPLPPPPRGAGTGPPRAAGAAASSPVLLLLGEEDEDDEGGSRRRRGLGRVEEKPRGGAEEEDDDEEDEDEEVVVEVVDGDDDEDGEERFVPLGPGRAVPRGPARGAVKVGSIKREMTFTFQPEDLKRDSNKKVSHQHLFPLAMEEDVKTTDTKKASRALDHEKENTRSVCLLEQKRKVVSSNIDVPPARLWRAIQVKPQMDISEKSSDVCWNTAVLFEDYTDDGKGSEVGGADTEAGKARALAAVGWKELSRNMMSSSFALPGDELMGRGLSGLQLCQFPTCRVYAFAYGWKSLNPASASRRKTHVAAPGGQGPSLRARTTVPLQAKGSAGSKLLCGAEQSPRVGNNVSSLFEQTTRKSSEELDMDKVTAAMVLTSLSTSPLVRSPPVRPNGTEGLSGSWKEGGGVSSSGSSGYWSWSAPSDQSNPSTPSPPLSADSFKALRSPAAPDDGIDEAEAGSLLFDEPIPRKRKNSMKVMFKCLWKNCGKVLSTAAGIQKHIRTIHLGRVGDSDYSDGEEDFYYTEIKLNTDSVADGPSSLAPVSPSQSPASPPAFPIPESSRTETPCAKTEAKLMTPLSRSAPTTLYLVHTDHAYQATPPVTIPGSAKFTPNGNSFSISWQSPPVTFTGIPVSPTHSHPVGPGEQRQHTHTVLSSPPRGTVSLRKPRGEGKKCRKVYGMENRDLWCTACRWKKACQRFID
ncbi:hypothetical protein HPG69_011477 [Diceros bicornis minor]|uniref:C2H2-type domain-containing protein n=1 Tax=Diceros bicornis minor TaxID=77932 RepID=A0A7J7FFB5_DICBM|nr:hypothetical protein HPG69_011477 [Diceros bicornis minor]